MFKQHVSNLILHRSTIFKSCITLDFKFALPFHVKKFSNFIWFYPTCFGFFFSCFSSVHSLLLRAKTCLPTMYYFPLCWDLKLISGFGHMWFVDARCSEQTHTCITWLGRLCQQVSLSLFRLSECRQSLCCYKKLNCTQNCSCLK